MEIQGLVYNAYKEIVIKVQEWTKIFPCIGGT